jgi:hypoxanthine phosphoribosyltransferase
MQILLTEEQVRRRIEEMAGEIRDFYGGRPLTIVAVLKGSVVLLADLMRWLDMPLRIDVVRASSYHDSTRPGRLTLSVDVFEPEVKDREVLLVDDIFDTGRTLSELLRLLDGFGPADLRIAVLLRKQGRCEVDVQPDFVGFDIPDRFVVGYGLDYRELHRNLPYIACLEPEDL